VLVIAKGCVPLSIVESQWLRRMVLQYDSKIAFPSPRQLVQDHIAAMLHKTMEQYVLLALALADTVAITFDLW
jgi:hypothetical protein